MNLRGASEVWHLIRRLGKQCRMPRGESVDRMKQSMPWDRAATPRVFKSSRSCHQGCLCCEVYRLKDLSPEPYSAYWLAILDGSGWARWGEAGGYNPYPIWDLLHANSLTHSHSSASDCLIGSSAVTNSPIKPVGRTWVLDCPPDSALVGQLL